MKKIIAIIIWFGSIQICYSQNAEDFYKEGTQYAKANNFTMALLSYTVAIEKNPYEPNYYLSRSYAFFATKDNDNALTDINMNLKLKPKHENIAGLTSRARILIDMRKYSAAIEDLTYIIDYFPVDMQTKFGLIHFERGKAFLYSGQKDKACLDFNESLSRRMGDAQKFIDEFCK